jgi:hypothetical protein
LFSSRRDTVNSSDRRTNDKAHDKNGGNVAAQMRAMNFFPRARAASLNRWRAIATASLPAEDEKIVSIRHFTARWKNSRAAKLRSTKRFKMAFVSVVCGCGGKS